MTRLRTLHAYRLCSLLPPSAAPPVRRRCADIRRADETGDKSAIKEGKGRIRGQEKRDERAKRCAHTERISRVGSIVAVPRKIRKEVRIAHGLELLPRSTVLLRVRHLEFLDFQKQRQKQESEQLVTPRRQRTRARFAREDPRLKRHVCEKTFVLPLVISSLSLCFSFPLPSLSPSLFRARARVREVSESASAPATMIDLTVKTLDSQNHVFSLEDDVSGSTSGVGFWGVSGT